MTPGVERYLFFDEVHPTATAHLLLGLAALDELGAARPALPTATLTSRVVPEPGTGALLAVAAALAWRRRR